MPHVLVPPSEGELFLSQQQNVSELFIKQGNKKKKKKDRGNEYDTQVWRMWEKLSKKGFGSRYFEKKVFSCENIEFREKCSTEIKPDGEANN